MPQFGPIKYGFNNLRAYFYLPGANSMRTFIYYMYRLL